MLNRKTFIIAAIIVLLFGAMTTAFAQTGEPIGYGDEVTGALTAAAPVARYTFEATEGDIVRISLTSSDFDAYLYLDNAAGTELTRNDDGGEGLNSLISGFAIPATGSYTIRASSFGGSSTGNFTLTLDTVEVAMVEYGQVITGDNTTPLGLYSFQANAGDFVYVILSTDSFSSELNLTGPDGQTTRGRYIDGRRTDLGPLELTQDGTYVLNANGSGTYRLSINRVEVTPITPGESVTVTFQRGMVGAFFSLEGARGDVLDIVANSDNILDTTLTLISPYGYEVATNNDAVGTVDPALTEQALSDTGTFYLMLLPFNPNATLIGDVTLRIGAAALSSLDEGPVVFNLSSTRNAQVATFEGVAGDIIRITMEVRSSASFSSPFLRITQGDNELVSMSGLRGINRLEFDFVVTLSGQINVALETYSDYVAEISLERNPDDEEDGS